MTLAEIGERVGLAPSSVSDIEQERTAEPRGDAAVALYSLHRSMFESRSNTSLTGT